MANLTKKQKIQKKVYSGVIALIAIGIIVIVAFRSPLFQADTANLALPEMSYQLPDGSRSTIFYGDPMSYPADPGSTDTILTVPTGVYPAKGWSLMSFPSIAETSIETLLKKDNYNPDGKVFAYDTATRGYLSFSEYLPEELKVIKPGLGYWVFLEPGDALDKVSYTATVQSPVEVVVGKGWNMIGNPFTNDYEAKKLLFKTSDGTYIDFESAINSGAVDASLQGYDSLTRSYTTIGMDDYVDKQVFPAWSGAWLMVKNENIKAVQFSQ